MTNTRFNQLTIGAMMLVAVLLPQAGHASTTDFSSIQSQFEQLMQRFESFKKQQVGVIGAKASSTAGTRASTTDKTRKTATSTVNRTCMATAVESREASIATAWSEFTTSVTEALDERSTALQTAWNETSTSKSGQTTGKMAWDKWKKANKDATAELRKDRRTAWETFRKTAVETCKARLPKEEAMGRDASGSIAL